MLCVIRNLDLLTSFANLVLRSYVNFSLNYSKSYMRFFNSNYSILAFAVVLGFFSIQKTDILVIV